MPTVNEELRDAAVRHSIYLTRYSTSVVNRMLALIDRADRDLIRQLRARNLPGARTPRQRARLEELLRGLREINRADWKQHSRIRRDRIATSISRSTQSRPTVGGLAMLQSETSQN